MAAFSRCATEVAEGHRQDSLKPLGGVADCSSMASKDIVCPVCSADLPLAGDEHSGEEVFCSVCSSPCILRGEPGAPDFEVEEDF